MNAMQIKVNNLNTILLHLIKEYNITEAQLARAINLPRGTINRIKSGKIRDPRSSTLTLIANYFNITIDQLLGYTPLSPSSQIQGSLVRVPVLNWEESVNFPQTDLVNHQLWVSFESESSSTNSLFALEVNGEAMWPYFDKGSIIIINTNSEPKSRNFVVVYIAKSKEIILRQLLIDGKLKILTPINNLFKPLTLEEEDHIIGVVIHAKKNF